MPLEHVEWFMKQSAHDNGKIHAQQCCTYYSVLNVNKANYPYLSSYEQEQTWTLTRTMSNNPKRYQSSIENIYLTTPNRSWKTKCIDHENINLEKDRTILSHLSSQDSSSSPTCGLFNAAKNSITQKITTNKNSKVQHNSNVNKPPLLTRPMRVIHSNGELVVRI